MRTDRRGFFRALASVLAFATGGGASARAAGADWDAHRGTRNTPTGARGLRWPRLSFPPDPFKPYPGAARLALPRVVSEPALPLAEVARRGETSAGFAATPLSLAQLGRLLHFANGVTDAAHRERKTGRMRAAPSAGALYAGEVYVVAERVRELAPGSYYYDVLRHALVQIERGSLLARAARALERKIGEVGADKVAAFVGEPIQGAGGVIIPPETYWPEIQRICEEHDILLVTDEVICGFGRLGEWFGADYYGVKPDLMTFAKGVTSGYLPLGGVMVGDRVSDVLIDKGGEFYHGYTYSGHPAACAVAIENIHIMQRENLVDYVRDDIGPYLQDKWQTLSEHPIVGETRMVGLMGALELVKDKSTLELFDKDDGIGTKCRDFLVNNGLVMRAVGDTIVVAPPLILTHAQADELVEKAWKCLELTAQAASEL